jgi:gamma-glutamyl-gamma-aminobutyraldehyde dehydrogenase
LSDAENIDLVAEHVVSAAFWNMGQNCSANSRLIVHKDLKAPLLERMVARLRDWKTGDPLEPGNHLGALIDNEHCQKVASYIAEAGSPPIAGGTIDGNFIAPTVFDNVETDSILAREEVFGPLLAVIKAGSDDEAIRIANDSAYGLTASVFTGNSKKAIRAAREIRAGTVTVNCYGEGDIATPFGGYKQSGFGGRDNSLHAHDQYTEMKTIWLDLSDPASGDLVQ